MPEINICNRVGRDAIVNSESVHSPLKVRWLDRQGRQARNIRVLKSNVERDIDALLEQYGDLSSVATELIDGDPEVDIETVGSFLQNTSRAFINEERQIVHKVHQWEIIRNPDGTQRDRRPKAVTSQNITEDLPLKWTGRLIPRKEAFRKFVFANKIQLFHINGLTYDFLYGIAQELHEQDSLMLVGAGPKSNQPLILRRGGTPYRGFLEGRIDGERYCLILHLSNLELKRPEPAGDDEPTT